MTRIEDETTAVVVERPTPTVPPSVLSPWRHATVPMMSAKAVDLMKPPMMSSVESPSHTAAMNELELMPKNCVETTHPPPMPTASAMSVRSGSVMMQRDEPRRDQLAHGVCAERAHGVYLLRDDHRAQLGRDGRGDAPRHHQPREHRPQLAHERGRHQPPGLILRAVVF